MKGRVGSLWLHPCCSLLKETSEILVFPVERCHRIPGIASRETNGKNWKEKNGYFTFRPDFIFKGN
jgi:hypothetical protein